MSRMGPPQQNWSAALPAVRGGPQASARLPAGLAGLLATGSHESAGGRHPGPPRHRALSAGWRAARHPEARDEDAVVHQDGDGGCAMHWTIGRVLVLTLVAGWLVGCASGPASRAGPGASRREAAAKPPRRAEDPALGALAQRTYGAARVTSQTAAAAAGFDRVAVDRVLTPGDLQLAETHLQAFGFDPGPVDGLLTAQTEAAVRAFPRRYGLSVSGLLDHATREELVPGLNPVPKH
jgi:hypothetical protein